jgi:SulP family sulfate permease
MSLVIVLALRRVAPVVPASLVAVIAGVIAVDLFDLESKGVAIVGPIDSGLPSIGPPDGLGLSDYLAAAGPAAGIMLVGFAEGLGAAKTYAARERAEINTKRELIGLGAANIGSGFVSGMVVNGSLSKTAVDWAAGARSQLSGITAAALTVITLLFLTDLFENLPEATLAAVVIAAVVELVDFASLKRYYNLYSTRLGRIYGRAARADFIAAVAAMLGVLVFDTLPGLVIGIVMSLLLLLYRASKPYVAELGQIPGAGHQYNDLDRHPTTPWNPASRCCVSSRGCFSPTPTRCGPRSSRTLPRRERRASSSTPKRSPSLTSLPFACSRSSPWNWRAGDSSWSSPTNSVRSETCSTSTAPRLICASTQPSTKRSSPCATDERHGRRDLR